MNFELICDYAEPEKYSAIRLHMDLPIAFLESDLFSELLAGNNWQVVKELLVDRYPQYKRLLEDWIANCEQRSEKPHKILAAVD